MSRLPIADHALISDCRSAALVTRHGSIDWLCWPRFDSPSVFARILDDEAGHWSIGPPAGADVTTTRRYLDRTMVLETTFTTPDGSVTLTDALAVGPNERGHELGAAAVGTVLRQVVGIAGEVELAFSYAPRPDYGRAAPELVRRTDGAVVGSVIDGSLVLTSSQPVTIDGAGAHARFTVRAGDSMSFALHHQVDDRRQGSEVASAADVGARLANVAEAWRTWSALHQSYDGPWADLVHLSGRVLYALTYFPTGAMVAAPTTSLPEEPGGARNWDYRYAWVRDASFTLQALWVAACPDEAEKFFEYVAATTRGPVRGGRRAPDHVRHRRRDRPARARARSPRRMA